MSTYHVRRDVNHRSSPITYSINCVIALGLLHAAYAFESLRAAATARRSSAGVSSCGSLHSARDSAGHAFAASWTTSGTLCFSFAASSRTLRAPACPEHRGDP